MTSSASPDETDSRTSSVGRRKRVFDQSSAAENTVAFTEDDSSNDENQPHGKRQRLTQEIDVNSDQVQGTRALPPTIIVIPDSPELDRSPRGAITAHSPENCQVGAAKVNGPPLSWNTGVPVTIRTSFTERKAQSPMISTHPDTKSHINIRNVDVDATGTSIKKSNEFPAELYSRTYISENFLTVTESVEKVVGTTPESGSKLQSPWLINNDREGEEHEKELEGHGIEESRSIQRESKIGGTGPPIPSSIVGRSASCFGPRLTQAEAEEIIKGLPEVDKNLMPRVIDDSSLEFYDMGRTFKLPLWTSENFPPVELSKISFRDSKYGFVGRFLIDNRSLLEFVDFKVLVKAFQEYIRLVYGHLPDRLLGMVYSNKYVTSSKAEKQCIRLLAEAKGRSPQELEPEVSNSQNAELEEAEAASGDIESISNVSETDKNKVSSRSGTGNILSGSVNALSSTLNMQPHNLAEYQRDTQNNSMSCLPGFERSLPQEVHFVAGENSHSIAKESLDDRGSMQFPKLESNGIQDSVPTSGQLDHEKKLAESHQAEIDLFHRYHPFADRHSVLHYCPICARTDHGASTCPSLTCAICGLRGEHFSNGCPKIQRCTRCHERGHPKSQCPEKLAATAHGSRSCDICGSSRHLESFCHFIWRTFDPDKLENIKLVADIPIYCYTCGAEGHYGPDCGIRQSTLYTDGYSWSIDNWKRYVDPQSQNRALSAGKDFRITSVKGTKGKRNGNNPQQKATANEDDDENVPFIREKAVKPQRPIPKGIQHIKFEQIRQDSNYYHSDRFEPPASDLRYNSSRPGRPAPPQHTYGNDPHEFSYRWRDDSARHVRERSFSPPPRYYHEQNPPRPGENFNSKKEHSGNQRPHNRGGSISGSNIAGPAPNGRGSPKQGPPKRGAAQSARGGAGATPRGKRQRNRKS